MISSPTIAFYFAHPSQYHVFKYSIANLKQNGHKVFIFIKTKDILENLLIAEGVEYTNVLPKKKGRGIFALFSSVLKRNITLFYYFKKYKINLLVSAASDSCQASFFAGIPSIVLNDDDADVIKKSAIFGWPFASVILAPKSCKMGYWQKKTIFYNGYQKTSYLHPNYFSIDFNVLKKYSLDNTPFFIIRSVSLSAHHDVNIRGLNNDIVEELISILSPYGRVLISSEKELPEKIKNYQLLINPLDMHSIIYFSKMLIGDSQSMAHEAALLGTPSIRYNDFVGKIGVLEELEHDYKLTFGISPNNADQLVPKVLEIAAENDKNIYKLRAQEMVNEMIDLTALLTWIIEEYPSSIKVLKENPNFQYNFK